VEVCEQVSVMGIGGSLVIVFVLREVYLCMDIRAI